MQEEDKSNKRLLRPRHCPSYHSKAAAAAACRRRTAAGRPAGGGTAGHPAHGGSALSAAAAGRAGSDRLRLRHFDLVHLTNDLVNVDDVLVLVYEVLGREAGAVARVSPAQTHCRLGVKIGLLHFKYFTHGVGS
jgi:hypothetical protein